MAHGGGGVVLAGSHGWHRGGISVARLRDGHVELLGGSVSALTLHAGRLIVHHGGGVVVGRSHGGHRAGISITRLCGSDVELLGDSVPASLVWRHRGVNLCLIHSHSRSGLIFRTRLGGGDVSHDGTCHGHVAHDRSHGSAIIAGLCGGDVDNNCRDVRLHGLRFRSRRHVDGDVDSGSGHEDDTGRAVRRDLVGHPVAAFQGRRRGFLRGAQVMRTTILNLQWELC